jgi:CRISPR-associated endonuclease/helicase Cas3
LFRERGARFPTAINATPVLAMLVAGLISVCDWIGSQADRFPYRHEPQALPAYYEYALLRAEEALSAIGLISGHPIGGTFGELFDGLVPRDVQSVTEALSLPEGPCLLIIEAQMGAGKTEAALSVASRLLQNGAASGLYFALPTMATSNAMLDRLLVVAPRLYSGAVNLVLAHGRSRLNSAFQALVESPLASPSAEADAGVVCARWFLSRKRALLGQVGVGTVDQAMQASLRVRHHFVRIFGLATSVVVIDEVHAYDVYMETILERLLEWLGALRTPVILLSATLPERRRAALVRAFLKGLGSERVEVEESSAYPSVTVASGAGVHVQAGRSSPARCIALRRVPTEQPERDLLPHLSEAVRRGGMVGWVRNTVDDAQRAYRAACDRGIPARLFHARYRACDRQRIERQVLDRFGRTGERRGELLIATQVVEQSLDLDFDLLATDLAPIDLILQRMGRLHRHDRHRPPSMETPSLLVVEPPEPAVYELAFGPAAHVYDPVTLWLAHDSLVRRDEIALPTEIRALVEQAYDPATRMARIEDAPNGAALHAAEERLERSLEEREANAKRVCVPPASFDIGGLLCFEDDDESVRALTRDGESATLLLVFWNGSTGRSIDGGSLWEPAPAAPDAWRLAQVLLQETLAVRAYPWERLRPGEKGLARGRGWQDWRKQLDTLLEAIGTRAIAIPVECVGDDFVGHLESDQRQREVRYSPALGLWFPRGGEC